MILALDQINAYTITITVLINPGVDPLTADVVMSGPLY
jgi:hypothetical protein